MEEYQDPRTYEFKVPRWAQDPVCTAELLEMEEGAVEVATHPISRRATTIGRIPVLVDLALTDHKTISRIHAALVFGACPQLNRDSERDVITVIDLNSSNGTFVRTEDMSSFERIVPFKPVVLGDGDSIRFGDSRRRLVIRGLSGSLRGRHHGGGEDDDSHGGWKRSRHDAAFRRAEHDGRRDNRPAWMTAGHAGREAKGARSSPEEGADRHGAGDGMSRSERHWAVAATTLGDSAKSDKFLRLLGAKKNKEGHNCAADRPNEGPPRGSLAERGLELRRVERDLERGFQSGRGAHDSRKGLGR